MAYATGTGANTQDLLDAVRSFATTSCGFTNDKNGSGYQFLSNGACKVAMQAGSSSLSDWTTGSAVGYTEWNIRFALATSFNLGLSTYYGHTGSLVTTLTDGDAPICNDLTGPYVAWHLFGGAGFVNVVVQSAALRFRHFGFGLLDKGSFTHGGVAYVTASGQYVRPATNNVNSMGHSAPMFSSTTPSHPYLLHGNNAQVGNGVWGAGTYIFSPDAFPTANQHISGQAALPGLIAGAMCNNLQDDLNGYGGLSNRLRRAGPTSFGNRSILFPIPVISFETNTLGRYVGRFPEVRYVNMQGLSAGQEMAFAGDTWKVFPLLAQNNWGTVPQVLTAPANSYQYGLAYKKVV